MSKTTTYICGSTDEINSNAVYCSDKRELLERLTDDVLVNAGSAIKIVATTSDKEPEWRDDPVVKNSEGDCWIQQSDRYWRNSFGETMSLSMLNNSYTIERIVDPNSTPIPNAEIIEEIALAVVESQNSPSEGNAKNTEEYRKTLALIKNTVDEALR